MNNKLEVIIMKIWIIKGYQINIKEYLNISNNKISQIINIIINIIKNNIFQIIFLLTKIICIIKIK